MTSPLLLPAPSAAVPEAAGVAVAAGAAAFTELPALPVGAAGVLLISADDLLAVIGGGVDEEAEEE